MLQPDSRNSQSYTSVSVFSTLSLSLPSASSSFFCLNY